MTLPLLPQDTRLTDGQDLLLCSLEDESYRCVDLSERVREFFDELESGDLAGEPIPRYFIGWEQEGIYTKLLALEKRGLVRRFKHADGFTHWTACYAV